MVPQFAGLRLEVGTFLVAGSILTTRLYLLFSPIMYQMLLRILIGVWRKELRGPTGRRSSPMEQTPSADTREKLRKKYQGLSVE